MSENLTANQQKQWDNGASIATMVLNQRQNLPTDQFRQVSELFGSTDTRTDQAWDSYGYKGQLEYRDFYTMFSRFGIGRACIMRPVDKCWQTRPKVVTKEEEHEPDSWEKEFQMFCDRFDLWERLKGLDWRQRITRYAGLIMFVADNKQMSQPLAPGGKLADIRPVLEGQLYPTSWDEDTTSIRYGLPIMYQLNEQTLGDKNQHSGRSIEIHYSRVIVWAEGADDGTPYGIPALEPIFNSLVSLERLIGAGGTGFWKAARQSMQLEIDSEQDLTQLAQSLNTDVGGLADALNDEVNYFQRGFDSVLALQGVKGTVFDFKMPNSKELFDNCASDVAAGIGIPMTILIGQQTGRLASDEDQSDWSQTNEARRSNFLSPAIMQTIIRFIDLGFLPSPKGPIFVQWDSLQEPSEKDKLELAEKMALVNKALMGTGTGMVFTADEMRKVTGREPLKDDDFGETDDDDEEVVDKA